MYFYDKIEQVFLNDAIHTIPDTAIQVSDDDFQHFIEERAKGKEIYVKDNQLFLTPTKPSNSHVWNEGKEQWEISEEKEKQQFKTNQQALIITLKNKADELGNQLLHEYPQIEQTSFSIQKEEAIAWQKDNSTPTPVLTGIATARNLELSELVARVIRKTTGFERVTGMIAGQRQAIMDKLEKATEQAQLDEIKKEIEQWQLSI